MIGDPHVSAIGKGEAMAALWEFTFTMEKAGSGEAPMARRPAWPIGTN
jgi:hypothetical protein